MICSLSFIELLVSNWPRSIAWYRDVLGLQLLMQSETDGFALLGAGPARLALKAGDPAVGGVLLAFEVDDLDAWLERLRALDVAVEGPVKTSAEGYRRIRLRDPDGYALSLFAWIQQGD